MVSQSQVLEPAAAFRPGVQLPARVVRALQAERERGEILTSWVQAGVLCVFATLYFLAPSTSPVHILMRPVPWALAFYAAFTAFRLYLVYTGRLGPAMRALSVLRALSFSPGHVLLAGITAALGWFVLLGYALAEPAAWDS